MLANSALDKPAEFQARAAEPQSPVRAVLPSPAGAAQPPEQPFKKPSRLAENRPQRRALKRLKRTAGASQAIRRTQSKAAQAEKLSANNQNPVITRKTRGNKRQPIIVDPRGPNEGGDNAGFIALGRPRGRSGLLASSHALVATSCPNE
jgi:hypothetical protein